MAASTVYLVLVSDKLFGLAVVVLATHNSGPIRQVCRQADVCVVSGNGDITVQKPKACHPPVPGNAHLVAVPQWMTTREPDGAHWMLPEYRTIPLRRTSTLNG